MLYSSILNLVRHASAIRVVRLRKSCHGSKSSSSAIVINCSRSVTLEVLLAMPSVVSSLTFSFVVCSRRHGVPMISWSILRCVHVSVMSMSCVSVHDALPYIMVGVSVQSNNCNLDSNLYVLLVSSCRNKLNWRHA